jgi:hypothetical protein
VGGLIAHATRPGWSEVPLERGSKVVAIERARSKLAAARGTLLDRLLATLIHGIGG